MSGNETMTSDQLIAQLKATSEKTSEALDAAESVVVETEEKLTKATKRFESAKSAHARAKTCLDKMRGEDDRAKAMLNAAIALKRG